MTKAIRTVSLVLILGIIVAGCSQGKFSLNIFADKNAIAADVYIDSKQHGKLEPFGDGSHLSIWLPHGTHVVEIKKEGYIFYRQEISVKEGESEYYMEATLTKS